jgi:hypothetical protein
MIENAKVVKISLHYANVFSKYANFFSTTPPPHRADKYKSAGCCHVKFLEIF